MPKIDLPFEIADGIVVAILKDQLDYLKKELKDHKKKGSYMHPEDVYESEHKLIPSLKIVIKYFGGGENA